MYKKITSILKAGKKRQFLALSLTIAAIVAVVIYNYVDAYVDEHDNELIVGFVTDIHAGSAPTREKGSGIISPSHFRENLTKALNSMQDEDYVIALGDNLDQRQDCQKYADDLKKITQGYDILWVKGNHDKDACFPYLYSKKYYYLDIKDWRIMIIDNSSWYPKDQRQKMGRDEIGLIDQTQLDWIKNTLNTDRKVLIAMHVPMWNDNGPDKPFTLRKDYVDFKKMIEEHGNVRYVLAGHYHDDNWRLEENGINYYILPSVEQQGQEGYQMTLKLE